MEQCRLMFWQSRLMRKMSGAQLRDSVLGDIAEGEAGNR